MKVSTITLRDYLQGIVRGIVVSDEALQTICIKVGIPDTEMYKDELSEKQQDLALAELYRWLASGSITTARWSESDGDWSQSGGGESFSKDQINQFIRWADLLYAKWGLPTIGGQWGMRVGGIRNIRHYNTRYRR